MTISTNMSPEPQYSKYRSTHIENQFIVTHHIVIHISISKNIKVPKVSNSMWNQHYVPSCSIHNVWHANSLLTPRGPYSWVRFEPWATVYLYRYNTDLMVHISESHQYWVCYVPAHAGTGLYFKVLVSFSLLIMTVPEVIALDWTVGQ